MPHHYIQRQHKADGETQTEASKYLTKYNVVLYNSLSGIIHMEVLSMAKEKALDRDQKNIRLSSALRAELSATAKREKRTESAVIEAALEEYFQRGESTGLPDELVRAVEEYLARQGYHPATG